MSSKPKYPTAEDALAEAILRAQAMETGRLHDVMFGQYSAVGEGWWFELKFLVEFGTEGPGQPDLFGARVERIVKKWSQDVARYAQDEDEGDRRAGDEGVPRAEDVHGR